MGYKMDMNGEKKPSFKVLLPEGWRRFKIIDCEEKTSKAGNMMFVITAQDCDTLYDDTWYAIGEPKKRWFLKSILEVVGCQGSQDGVYDWDISDIIGKELMGLVVHEDNEWINREGEKIAQMQHRVVDVKKAEQLKQTEKSEQEKAWDDE